MNKVDNPISHCIRFSELKEADNEFEIQATENQLKGIAEKFEILEAKSFSAKVNVRIWRKSGIEATGALNATVVQECVVTLRPVENTISTNFTIRLVPQEELHKHLEPVDSDGLIEISLEESDPPESFNGSTIDLGEIALEQFALSLDPFPRAENASFDEFLTEVGCPDLSDPKLPSPFAELSKLKLNK